MARKITTKKSANAKRPAARKSLTASKAKKRTTKVARRKAI